VNNQTSNGFRFAYSTTKGAGDYGEVFNNVFVTDAGFYSFNGNLIGTAADYNLLVNLNGSAKYAPREGPNGINGGIQPAAIFVDLANGDLRLKPDSPAINSGTDLNSTGFSTDFAGVSRPQGPNWDIGAYEYIPEHYVRADAPAGGDGSDWDKAWQQLPTVLQRGHTYYIADGNYNGYAFDDAESGTDVITIKKATVAAHGTDTGWDDSYGDGQAVWAANLAIGSGYFSAWAFLTGYYVVDGVSGGGPESWASGHGFVMSDQNTQRYFILISDKFSYFGPRRDISNVTISHTEVRGRFALCASSHAVNATASGVTKTDIAISYNYFHDLSPIMISAQTGVSNWTIEHNKFDHLYSGLGVQGCHGSLLRMDNAHDVTVRYNNLSNAAGSNWIGAYNGIIYNIFVYGNYFYCDDPVGNCWASPGLISSEHATGDPDISGYHIYNNSFYNLHPMDPDGRVVSIPYLVFIEGGTGTDNYIHNNVFYGCEVGSYFLNPTTHKNNACEENIPGDEGFQLLTSDPYVYSAGRDFRLSKALNAGTTLLPPYNQDMLGNVRGLDGAWDRGAYEYVAPYGDVSGDGSITAYDAALALQLGKGELEAARIAQRAAGII